MPQHRRLNVKKFLDSVSEFLIKEYFERFFAGNLQLDAYDSDSVLAFMDAPGHEALKSPSSLALYKKANRSGLAG